MGIAGAGNSGTALAALLAPRLAQHYGWHQVYGFAALTMLLPLTGMIIFAKEPPDTHHQTLKQHLSCLWEKDGWAFNSIYIITFGGSSASPPFSHPSSIPSSTSQKFKPAP
jgi:MFS transporter, NNP family, nitrate/nitrite transporter